MPSANVRGTDLQYEEAGEGPTLVMAHGLMGSVAQMPQYGECIDAIARMGIRVVAYDARGHGRSGWTREHADYTWPSHMRDMLGLLDALEIERASVFGGSMGAGTALLLAIEHPERVEKLILRSPPPFGRAIKRPARPFRGLARLYRIFGPRMTSRIVMALPQMRAAQRQQPQVDLRAFFASQNRRAVVLAIEGLFDGPSIPARRFESITQPTLILAHPGDELHPLASGELLHARLPHARLAVAPSATYWSENAEALTHVIAAFVRGEPIAAGLPEPAHRHVP